jgi:hypothetical protein
MQAETQQNLPLEEVSSGKANGVRGVAPRADNLIDGSGHGSVGCLQGGVPHMQYALPDGALATCFIGVVGNGSRLSTLNDVGEFQDDSSDGQRASLTGSAFFSLSRSKKTHDLYAP